MIHEVDEAMKRLIKEEALSGSRVDVVLEAPTKDWAARRNAPTINMYLYDIREDLKRRTRNMPSIRNDEGTVVARRFTPRYIKLSYLVTAWTQRVEDEHRLLSTLMIALLKLQAVPDRFLGEELRAAQAEVPLTAVLPPPEDRSFADVWSAMGGELKPSLDVVVSAPVVLQPPVPVEAHASSGVSVRPYGRERGPDGRPMAEPSFADDHVGHKPPEPTEGPRQPAGGMRRTHAARR